MKFPDAQIALLVSNATVNASFCKTVAKISLLVCQEKKGFCIYHRYFPTRILLLVEGFETALTYSCCKIKFTHNVIDSAGGIIQLLYLNKSGNIAV